MLPYSFVGQGTYTNGSSLVAVNVAVSDQPDWIYVKDITNWGAQSTAASPVYSEWYSNMAAASYLALSQPSSTTTGVTLYASQGSSGGFTFIDPSNPPLYAALTGTTINDSSVVVAMASTGSIAVGDVVRVLNPTGLLQFGGLVAQVTAVTTNTSITLGYVASAISAGLTVAAGATACSILKFIPGNFYPRKRQVLYVTQATNAVVYFAQPNDFTVGEYVDFSIPTPFGMTQLSYLTGSTSGPARVLAVTNSATTSSITLNVNSSGYTAFVYPASASFKLGASPPYCVPAGSGLITTGTSSQTVVSPPGTNLADSFDNRNQFYMQIGTSACGIANATMQYWAMKADWANLSNA